MNYSLYRMKRLFTCASSTTVQLGKLRKRRNLMNPMWKYRYVSFTILVLICQNGKPTINQIGVIDSLLDSLRPPQGIISCLADNASFISCHVGGHKMASTPSTNLPKKFARIAKSMAKHSTKHSRQALRKTWQAAL